MENKNASEGPIKPPVDFSLKQQPQPAQKTQLQKQENQQEQKVPPIEESPLASLWEQMKISNKNLNAPKLPSPAINNAVIANNGKSAEDASNVLKALLKITNDPINCEPIKMLPPPPPESWKLPPIQKKSTSAVPPITPFIPLQVMRKSTDTKTPKKQNVSKPKAPAAVQQSKSVANMIQQQVVETSNLPNTLEQNAPSRPQTKRKRRIAAKFKNSAT